MTPLRILKTNLLYAKTLNFSTLIFQEICCLPTLWAIHFHQKIIYNRQICAKKQADPIHALATFRFIFMSFYALHSRHTSYQFIPWESNL